MAGKPTSTLTTPIALPQTARGKKNLPADSVFDKALLFNGNRPEFAALLLTSAFSSKLLRNGIIFSWNGPDQPPTIESSLPRLLTEQMPFWFKPVLEFLNSGNVPTRIQVFPPVNPTGERSSRGELLVPLAPDEKVYAAFEMSDIHPGAMTALMQNMEFFVSLWRFYQLRQTDDPTDALAPALRVLSVVNQTNRFQQYAMSLCNELASRFSCDRVSLGLVRGRYVRMTAMSHTEKFSKRMNLVRAIELAMEECLDQDVETVHPEPRGFSGVSRAAADLARQFGSGSVITIPIRYNNKPAAALTLEKGGTNSPEPREIKQLRLIAELTAPRMMELRQHDRWFGARFGSWLKDKAGLLLGTSHTMAKLAAVACLVAAGFLAVARGEYRVDATFVTQPVEQRVVAAPFDGFVQSAKVRPGELLVEGETLMAELETSEMRSLLAMRRAEQRSHEKDASLARRDNKLAEAQVAEAKAEQAEAECLLLEERIRQARIYAPLTGVTLSGDWSKKIGAPVKQGDALFEVAPLENMEADLYVPEEDIAEIRVGQFGELAAAGRPDEKIRFQVVRITPVAELVKQKNVFRVQVKLTEQPDWLRPGLEGLAKVDVDERLLVDIWTRRAINWLRMKLWM